ncbi:hypothetical protein BDC45DRAFT_529848 [Circinella umbellata]|nr:hypothetical protein BDC45DRAFT_529848 [Circinella umbellata]
MASCLIFVPFLGQLLSWWVGVTRLTVSGHGHLWSRRWQARAEGPGIYMQSIMSEGVLLSCRAIALNANQIRYLLFTIFVTSKVCLKDTVTGVQQSSKKIKKEDKLYAFD